MKRLLTTTAIVLFATAASASGDNERGYAGASSMTGGSDNGQSLNGIEENAAEAGELGYGGASTITGGYANEDDQEVRDAPTGNQGQTPTEIDSSAVNPAPVAAASEQADEAERGYGGASTMTGGTDNGQNLNEFEETLADTDERGYGGASTMTGGNALEDDAEVSDAPTGNQGRDNDDS
ncbi:MAG: hypothetical protein AAFN79_05625 [Pseudomonadota bacterium]